MAASYNFVQLDVFTQTPLAGNPLAVFTDARGLTDKQMQALAREMNLSETTFILPRDPQIEAREGKRVRIFNVAEEMPFAGHPTLGTALYLYSTMPAVTDEIVLDLNIGKIPVRFTAGSTNASRDGVDGNVFGEMRQRDPEFGLTLARDKIAAALGIDTEAIASEWPSQVVSTGFPFAIVPIRDVKTLTNLKRDLFPVPAHIEGTGARLCYFLCPQPDKREARARMFFYGGEDPATGSAGGCAIAWMVRHGLTKSGERMLIRQGVEAGRPGEIFARATRKAEDVTNVRVGGHAIEVLRGTVTL
jgi:trans-2,3-dihydro-3-hydroxyanthranilate isomerase